MQIGVDRSTSQWYAGSKHAGHPLDHAVLLQRFVPLDEKFSQLQSFPVEDHYIGSFAIQEFSFDPVSRIKRGILYRGDLSMQPHYWDVVTLHHTKEKLSLLTFETCRLQYAFAKEKVPEQAWCAIGEKNQYTIGSIMAVDRLIDGRELLTIRMRGQYGILPEIDRTEMSDSDFAEFSAHMEKVLSGVHTSPPESVIDRCREAATHTLAVYLKMVARDLGSLVDELEKNQKDKVVAISSARLIGRLHARGKTAEQNNPNRDLPTISEKDAELAVLCLGTILRDLGYAHWAG